MTSPYQKALESGYSEDQIKEYFRKKIPDFDNKYKKAIESGFSNEQIFSHIGKSNQIDQTPSSQISQQSSFDQENDLERDIERQTARLTSRGIETGLGALGDIYSFGKSLFGLNPETILPTSEKLKKFSETATRGYTKPQTEFEKKGDELFSDVVSLSLPGSSTYGLFRNIGIPVAGMLAKEGVESLGGDESSQSLAKTGLMVALDLVAQRKNLGGGAKKYASGLFQKFKEKLPDGIADASGLVSNLNILEETLLEGGKRPSTAEALEKISEIRNAVKDGKIPVKKLYPFRESINEIIDSFGGYEMMKLPSKIRQKAINNLQDVKGSVINTVSSFLEKNSPEVGQLWKNANEAYAAYEKSNKIASFMKKHFGNALKSNIAKTLIGLGSAGGYLLSPIASASGTALGLGGAGAYQAFKVLHRMKNSPTLRKYYFDILKYAGQGNASQVAKNLRPFEKEVEKAEKESN